MAAIAYGVRILRPRRPEKTRLTRVSSGSAPLIASAQAVGILASGDRRKPVPISTADAPRIKAAATPLGSPIPPDATTGTVTALLTAGSKENKPTIFLSASAALKAPLWPPASMPCATITSAPASSAIRASVTVVALANHLIPLALKRITNSGG